MLVQKDTEIKRLREKTIGGRKPEPKKNANNSGIDSDDDALSVVYQSDNSNSDNSDGEQIVKGKKRDKFDDTDAGANR